jgi:protein-disulfide isomerase
MEKPVRPIKLATTAIFGGFILLAPCLAQAQEVRGEIEQIIKDYLAAHPDEVGEIVKTYLIKHPAAVGEILVEVLKHRATLDTNVKTGTERGSAISSNAETLFSSPHQVTLGNPHGDATLVEFFDYNCGYCKRALPDMLTLIKNDPKLKIVLKEFPILGPGSNDAARVAIAVRMQDANGQKYLAFHQELLGGPGQAGKEKALAAAKDQGLDMPRIEHDMDSDEAGATLDEDLKLAGALGITGTPGYVIGKNVVLGAVGIASLKGDIDATRAPAAN